MKENKITIEIDRAISDVFKFTINPINTHKWIDGIKEEQTNEWPVKIGSIYKNTNDGESWDEYVVLKLEQDSVFELKKENSSYGVRYEYEPLSDSKTRLTYLEWDEDGLGDPFTQSVLEKLKEVIEK